MVLAFAGALFGAIAFPAGAALGHRLGFGWTFSPGFCALPPPMKRPTRPIRSTDPWTLVMAPPGGSILSLPPGEMERYEPPSNPDEVTSNDESSGIGISLRMFMCRVTR